MIPISVWIELQIKELEAYVNLIEEKKPLEHMVIDSKNVIVNAILNTKCEEMQSKDILFVSRINDLSGFKQDFRVH